MEQLQFSIEINGVKQESEANTALNAIAGIPRIDYQSMWRVAYDRTTRVDSWDLSDSEGTSNPRDNSFQE